MKKTIKVLLVFVTGILFGYYINEIYLFKDIFVNNYKAFQVGVYTDYKVADTYSKKYKNSIIIKDNELYRIYAAILKDENNIESMKKYLSDNNINYYLRDIEIKDKKLINEIKDCENIMNNNNELVFLEVNKIIMEKFKESL